MFTLPHVFANGALFQGNASLSITGQASPNAAVTGTITRSGTAICSALTETDADGRFTLSLHTPSPSFDPCTVTLTCGEDVHIMEDVLFGELWLASGQSNMEFANDSNPKCKDMYAEVAQKTIRVYHVDYPSFGAEGAFPWDPDTMMTGHWISSDDGKNLGHVSALGLKFVNDLYDFLNFDADVPADVPVGFLNATWGGTSMPSWFRLSELEKETDLCERMKKLGNYPTPENWNTRGGGNFQQTCSQYNVKIAPLEGVKVRGVIWYQGENECGGQYWHRMYADYLRAYHRMYTRLFAAYPGDFMMISSLIYPWTYGGSGECNVGYLNDAFVETALESPDKFAYAPIGDLEPVWSYHQGNHPIHPANKYEVGARMARLALTNVYGDTGMKSPAYLDQVQHIHNRMVLTFKGGYGNLHVGHTPGEALHGLYIAGDDGIYLPAEYDIADNNILCIWNDAIPEPKHAAYAVQSLDVKCNLFCGDCPVTPFFTDKETYINIEQKPWYDTSVNSRWASRLRGDILDLFFHPVFHPIPGSEVCCDTAFRCQSNGSIRVCSEDDEKTFGCYVKSYPYGRLDLQKFKGLRVNLYNTGSMTAELVLTTADGDTVLPFKKLEHIGYGWDRYEAVFGELADTEITRMTFRFTRDSDRFHFVNMERIRLTK